MSKLISTAKKLDNFFNIAQSVIFALAVAAGVFIGLISVGYLLGWDPSDFGTGYENLDIGFLELTIADGFAPNKWLVLLEAGIRLALSLVCLLIAHRGIRCIRAILQPMSLGQPFDGAVSINLRKLAVLGIFMGIAFNFIGLAEQLLLVYAYDIDALLLSEKIAQIDLNYTLDLSFLIYCAVLLLLSYVFRYGEELQQLSDETL